MKRQASSLVRKKISAACLFDIDGVIIDVRRSYQACIAKTVQLYLEKILDFPPSSRPVLSLRDVDNLKLLGGFNNDWDAVYGFLSYFQFLKEKNPGIRTLADLKKKINFKALRSRLPNPCGVHGIIKLVTQPESSYALARDMFQEIYLGRELFKKLYRKEPIFWRKKGLIESETCFISRQTLEGLRKSGFKLGIVTGRIRFEAEHVLRRFKIRNYFSVLITHDDVEKAEKKSGQLLRKPHPYPVLQACRKLKCGNYLYFGDLPDDVRAANRSKPKVRIRSAAVLYSAVDRKETVRQLQSAKPDLILQTPRQILPAARRIFYSK